MFSSLSPSLLLLNSCDLIVRSCLAVHVWACERVGGEGGGNGEGRATCMHTNTLARTYSHTTFLCSLLVRELLGLVGWAPVHLAGIVFCSANNCPQFHIPSLRSVEPFLSLSFRSRKSSSQRKITWSAVVHSCSHHFKSIPRRGRKCECMHILKLSHSVFRPALLSSQ